MRQAIVYACNTIKAANSQCRFYVVIKLQKLWRANFQNGRYKMNDIEEDQPPSQRQRTNVASITGRVQYTMRDTEIQLCEDNRFRASAHAEVHAQLHEAVVAAVVMANRSLPVLRVTCRYDLQMNPKSVRATGKVDTQADLQIETRVVIQTVRMSAVVYFKQSCVIYLPSLNIQNFLAIMFELHSTVNKQGTVNKLIQFRLSALAVQC